MTGDNVVPLFSNSHHGGNLPPSPERLAELFRLADAYERDYERFLAARYDADLAEWAALRAARRREIVHRGHNLGRPRLRVVK
jgi:hypothetical protein